MQLIAVDIGNSATKIAVEHAAQDDRWCLETVIRGDDMIDLASLKIDDQPAFWSVCSVNRERQQRLENAIARVRPNDQFHVISPDDVELQSNVESRNQLGRDRLVAAWMSVQLNSQAGSLIVIDAGTAVTVDFVDHACVFQGGAIFPGAESNFRQLSQSTDALPDLQTHARSERMEISLHNGLGKSTTEAILLGVYSSQLASIRHLVHSFAQLSQQPVTVFATGGGIFAIESELDDSWQHVPDLVIRGAREIGRKLLKNSTVDSSNTNQQNSR